MTNEIMQNVKLIYYRTKISNLIMDKTCLTKMRLIFFEFYNIYL